MDNRIQLNHDYIDHHFHNVNMLNYSQVQIVQVNINYYLLDRMLFVFLKIDEHHPQQFVVLVSCLIVYDFD